MSEAIIPNNTPETSFNSEATPALNPCAGMRKETYQIDSNFFLIIFWLVFLAVGIFIIVMAIKESLYPMILGGCIFALFPTLVIGCLPLSTSIIVDPLDGTLQVRKYKILICCWKKSEINLKEIRKIYTIDHKRVRRNKRRTIHYKTFDLIFELTNGEKKTVLSEERDRNSKKKDLLEFLYKFFPQIVGINSIELPTYPGAYMPQNNVYMDPQTPQILPPGQPMLYPPQQPMPYPVQQPMPYPVQQPMPYPVQQPMPYPVQQPMQPVYPGPQINVVTQNDLNNQLIDKPKDIDASQTL